MTIVSLNKVSKSFGEVRAVHDLTFDVGKGQIFGLLGPNGAGKTTTLRMIMDIIKPDGGEIVLFDGKPPGKVREKIGYLPEERGLYRKMKVSDVLMFFGRAKGLSSKEAKDRIRRWLERFKLDEWAAKKVEELSKGMQQKIQIVATVLHSPPLLILDEPFSGMDPVNTELLKDMLMELNKEGTSIIFSTHIMEQAEKLCSSLCIIKEGMAVLNGTLSSIKAQYGRNTVVLEYEGDGSFLESHPLVEKVYSYENYSEIKLVRGTEPGEILKDTLGKVRLRRFELMEPSLHTIYLDQVGKS